jgi:hypothetical protein
MQIRLLFARPRVGHSASRPASPGRHFSPVLAANSNGDDDDASQVRRKSNGISTIRKEHRGWYPIAATVTVERDSAPSAPIAARPAIAAACWLSIPILRFVPTTTVKISNCNAANEPHAPSPFLAPCVSFPPLSTRTASTAISLRNSPSGASIAKTP